ncbi:MAG TPA: type II toxin-antitoxin system RelE/ParE family toxin [Thermoanaerobaculia bacterium]|nr:type II toxin-antitoxin system RelE/ParE family toxin [Thermoanaerobaculia bacterium]
MTLPAKFRKVAERDLIAAQRWYEDEQPGLGSRFRSFVEEAVERVRLDPERYPYANPRFRRILLRRPFRYTLYYSIEPDRIVFVACLHEKRNLEAILDHR